MHYCFFDYKSICINDFIFNGTVMLIQRYKKYKLILLNKNNTL